MKHKVIILTVQLFFIFVGCNPKTHVRNNCDNGVVDSIVVLGRNPNLFYSRSIGRYEFVDACYRYKTIDCNSILITDKDVIEDIIKKINDLKRLDLKDDNMGNPSDFPYKPIMRNGCVYFLNNDSIDVMILLVLYTENGKQIPIWIDLNHTDIYENRFSSSKELVHVLYNLLGYDY